MANTTGTSAYDANNRMYLNDASGRILLANQQGGHIQQQFIANGEVFGRYGSVLNPEDPRDANGNPLFADTLEVNFGYTAISGAYPAATPSNYTVAAGDTLKSIARTLFGDESLWYIIADANSVMADSDLRVGQALIVPNRVTGAKNNATSFKPYNPGSVVGDTTPNLPDPPPILRQQQGGGGGGDCGGLAPIFMLVIAVVVTVWTSGALGPSGAGV